MEKIKYEKPISLDAGRIDPVKGDCISGTSAAGTVCSGGFDVDNEPLCSPDGLNATNNCKLGHYAGNGCEAGEDPTWPWCNAGTGVGGG